MGNGTSIGRVRGLGSAHNGSHHWLVQRFTAIGNLVLTVWFVASLLMLPNLGFETVREWIARPLPAAAMALLVITTFWPAIFSSSVTATWTSFESWVASPTPMFRTTLVIFGTCIGLV